VIYNTEARGALHNALAKANNYLCSEYLGTGYKSGQLVGSTMHQDLRRLSFADNSIDLIVSSDVFEHVPDPYRAHREILRVLKPNGRHVFTVPFYQTEFLDEHRAIEGADGRPVFMKEPQYHADPLRGEGILVYTIFSLQMLVELAQLGFKTRIYKLYCPSHGIYGQNGIVFEAIKQYSVA